MRRACLLDSREMLPQYDTKKDRYQAQYIAGKHVEQRHPIFSCPYECHRVEREGREGGETTEKSGKEECPGIDGKMIGFRYTPAEAD